MIATSHGPALLGALVQLAARESNGISEVTWTGIAAVAQAVAAFGAIALLITTYISLRDAGAALEHSDRLATQTEALVQTMREAQVLAVKPVVELRRDRDADQVTVANVGNGPLLEPVVASASDTKRLMALDGSQGYVEIGSLKVGQKAFVILEDARDLDDGLVLSGFTAAGDPVRWNVHAQALGVRPVVVASAS